MKRMTKMDYLWGRRSGFLQCGHVHPEHFRQLIAISGIHSPRVIQSLEDYLVRGISRRIICESRDLSASYLSTSLSKLQRLSAVVAEMASWYTVHNQALREVSGGRWSS